MAKARIKQKYPCGYEFEIELSSWFAMVDYDAKLEDNEGCPLHGKNCNGDKTRGDKKSNS